MDWSVLVEPLRELLNAMAESLDIIGEALLGWAGNGLAFMFPVCLVVTFLWLRSIFKKGKR